MKKSSINACAIGLATAGVALGSVWDETVDGDLSDDELNPTAIVLGVGSNVISGSVGPGLEDDFFVFTIDAGFELSAINLVDYSPAGNTTFLGVDDSATYDAGANSEALGFTFFGVAEIGTDLLPSIAASNGGFTGSLGPGTYTWWLDEGTGPQDYAVDFVLVPAPGAAGLLGLAGLIAARRRR
jgi:hypothetical protein